MFSVMSYCNTLPVWCQAIVANYFGGNFRPRNLV